MVEPLKKSKSFEEMSNKGSLQGDSQIRDVWTDNFYEELATISSLIETKEYNILSFVSFFFFCLDLTPFFGRTPSFQACFTKVGIGLMASTSIDPTTNGS